MKKGTGKKKSTNNFKQAHETPGKVPAADRDRLHEIVDKIADTVLYLQREKDYFLRKIKQG